MEAVSNFHDFVSGLPEAVVYDIRACLKSRGFAKDEVVFRGIRMLLNLLVDASLLRLPARVARTIQRLLISMAKRDADGATYLQCSHDELARYVAASRQSTSIELKKLEQAGIIRSAYGKIYLLDQRALNDLCDQLTGFEPIAPSYPNDQA